MWTPGGRRGHVEKLIKEVDEYFALGLVVKPGDVVFDVGANVGLFAMAVARRCPQARIYAFEPIAPLFQALEQNLFAFRKGGGEVHFFPIGIAANQDETSADFYFFRRFPSDSTRYIEAKRREHYAFFDRGAERWRSMRMVPAVASDVVQRLVRTLAKVRLGPWLSDQISGIERFRCDLRTLSHIIDSHAVERIDVIKIDVEGAELDVLRGILPEHWSRVQKVVIEGHDEDGALSRVRALLREVGLIHFVESVPACATNGLNNYLLFASR